MIENDSSNMTSCRLGEVGWIHIRSATLVLCQFPVFYKITAFFAPTLHYNSSFCFYYCHKPVIFLLVCSFLTWLIFSWPKNKNLRRCSCMVHCCSISWNIIENCKLNSRRYFCLLDQPAHADELLNDLYVLTIYVC